MRFLLDMNLPPSIAELLKAAGHDAVHARAAGYSELPDLDVFERAAKDKRIVVTFDLDFGDIAGVAHGATGIVLLRLRSARQSSLWERLQAAIAQAGEAMEAGAIVLIENSRIRIRRMPPQPG